MSSGTIIRLTRQLAPLGMIVRGGFIPEPGDHAPPDAAAVLLVGNAGPAMWRVFQKAPPAGDNPLDRWTRRGITPIADEIGAAALFPFDGPPWWPFQSWAVKAEPVFPSPLGILIHPQYGLWHGYRAALAFRDAPSDMPVRRDGESPCHACADKPCLSACPVGAVAPDGTDIPRCRGHLATPQGAPCMEGGCLARAACPVGEGWRHDVGQERFHMDALELPGA